jgi:hypothetical protein
MTNTIYITFWNTFCENLKTYYKYVSRNKYMTYIIYKPTVDQLF